jgi:hypothetical protein
MEPDFDSSDPFAQLGIPTGSDKLAIRKAYKALVRQYRPETHPDEFQKIRTAYEEALADLRWREDEEAWPGPPAQDEAGEEEADRDDEPENDDYGDDPELDAQVFTPIFDKPWPEPDEESVEIPADSLLSQLLPHAAWADQEYLRQGLELEALLDKRGAGAARKRLEALEHKLEEELGEEDGRLTWLRLGTFLVRALAPKGSAKEINRILEKIDDERDLDEECFEVLEFSIVILRARAEIEKADRKKYPQWFIDFVFRHIDTEPAETNQGLADLRESLLNNHKKLDIDWLDQLNEDLPNFGTIFHILMQHHAEGLIGIIEEGEIQRESGEAWDLDALNRGLEQLENQLVKGRPWQVTLNLLVAFTFGLSVLGFVITWIIRIFDSEYTSSYSTLPLLAIAWLLSGCVDRSYAYRFLVRRKLRRFLAQHDAPVAILTALIRLREGSLGGLDYYLPAIEADPKLPPRYSKRDFTNRRVPLPYLGNLSPR